MPLDQVQSAEHLGSLEPTDNSYLKRQIIGALVEKDIIDMPKPSLIYSPVDRGEGWRGLKKSGKAFFNKHSKALAFLGVAGLVVAGGVAYFFPESRNAAIGVGAASGGLGYLAAAANPMDKLLSAESREIAEKTFSTAERSWKKAYESIQRDAPFNLDDLVTTATNSDAVYNAFTDPKHQSAFGVGIAGIVDYLSAVSDSEELKKRHNIPARIISLMSEQKTSERDWGVMDPLFQNYEPKKIASMLAKFKKDRFKGSSEEMNALNALDCYVNNSELVLKLQNINGPSVAAQLSRGHVYVKGSSTGSDMGGFMGEQSRSKKYFARLTAKDDVGSDFMANSYSGLGWVGGSAEQRVMDKSRGGGAVIEMIAESAGMGMTDTENPAFVVAIGGLKTALNGVENGLVISLYTDNELRRPATGDWKEDLFHRPCIYAFRGGNMTHEFLDGNTLEKSAKYLNRYIAEWEPGKGFAV
jgi:hypothetical protein